MAGNVSVIVPLGILIVGAFLIYLLARILNLSNRAEAILTVLVLGATLVTTWVMVPSWFGSTSAFFGVLGSNGVIFQPNALGIFIFMISLVLGGLVSFFSAESLSQDVRYLVYYPLILLSLAGLLGMFMTQDLFNLFLLTELTTITVSALVGFRYHQDRAIRAGFKYLIMSSLGTLIMLLGIYFVYRGSGELGLQMEIPSRLDFFSRIGGACFLVGFSLKAGVVPLHTWVADVYSQAPSAVSALLSGVISKSMLFMLPIICLRLGITRDELGIYLIVFACLNMLLGVIRALNQRELRRFLSYSSIAQTGYLMFALGIGIYYDATTALTASLFVFLGEAVLNSLVFLSAGAYEYHLNIREVRALNGVNRKMPAQALCFSVGLAGLAGIPLLAGFTGKWLTFSAAIAVNDLLAWVGLAIFLISTVIGLAGYLPVLVRQYQPAPNPTPGPTPEKVHISSWMTLPIGVLTVMVILLGLYPNPWMTLIGTLMEWLAL